MPVYLQRGRIPRKRHIAFRRDDGDGIYYEELIGNRGFQGPSSLLYHIHRPTQLRSAEVVKELRWEPVADRTLRPHHFRLGNVPRGGDVVLDRVPVLMNGDVALTVIRPERDPEGFYRNGQGDELLYVFRGSGRVESAFGSLRFGAEDYVVIPRGLTHRVELDSDDVFLLVIESATPVQIPSRYRNPDGQMLEGAPFSERDLRAPDEVPARDETGAFSIFTKRNHAITRHTVAAHPFDAVGWDGCYYPYAFNIRDFEPIVGRIHQPPPVHQTFQGVGFVVCSFVPRLFDFHPEAIPAPYHHSNAESEEVLLYASDEFMSRKGIEFGSATYHPDGMPHGPHPGTAEASIGARETKELAVMVDTFRPLRVAKAILDVDDPGYVTSWLE